MQHALNYYAKEIVLAPRKSLRRRWFVVMLTALFAAPYGYANEACPANLGVQLIKKAPLLPVSPSSYAACGLPAASIAAARIAVADDDRVVGPSSCMSKVCMFDARSGARMSEWNLISAPPGIELSAHLAPLSDTLGRDSFKPMAQIELSKYPMAARGAQDIFGVTTHLAHGERVVTAYGGGYAKSTHRFKARTLICEGVPRSNRVPQDVRAWALKGMPAIALAAQYYGEEPGCSWTQWVVMPIGLSTKKKPTIDSARWC